MVKSVLNVVELDFASFTEIQRDLIIQQENESIKSETCVTQFNKERHQCIVRNTTSIMHMFHEITLYLLKQMPLFSKLITKKPYTRV